MESIATTNPPFLTLEAMPPKSLAERVKEVRVAAGYGGDRQAAAFAKLIGIKPPSLHALESGETKALGTQTLLGLLRIGANWRFVMEGRGEPMQQKKAIEHILKSETLMSMLEELDEGETEMVYDVVKGIIRRKAGSSPNDPWKKDPPKDN